MRAFVRMDAHMTDRLVYTNIAIVQETFHRHRIAVYTRATINAWYFYTFIP